MTFIKRLSFRQSDRFFAALVLIILVSCDSGSKNSSEKDTKAIQATVDLYVTSALAADWDAWGRAHATDVIVSPPNIEPLRGREAAVAWARTFPKITGLSVTNAEITITGDVAYGFGLYSLSIELPGGIPATEEGTHMDIFRKQPDGTWLYSREIWHANAAMSMGAAN